MSRRQTRVAQAYANERLLQALAEQMKMPLLQIARRAELAQMTGKPKQHLYAIEHSADTALKLLDNYLLSLRLNQKSEHYLEPVSISAVLSNAAHELEILARQYQCTLELHLSGRYEPVMANQEGLEAALISLGYVFIEAQSAEPHDKPHVIKLAAHRGNQGIVAGMFANSDGLSMDMYRRAHQLYGHTRQPFAQLTAGSGAGVFVAESLLNSMSAKLRVARHQKLNGLAATFIPSQQLELIGMGIQ